MADKKGNNLIELLRAGERVLCDKCRKGYYIPYNISADKAHYYNCSNPECDSYIHWDPAIEIE